MRFEFWVSLVAALVILGFILVGCEVAVNYLPECVGDCAQGSLAQSEDIGLPTPDSE